MDIRPAITVLNRDHKSRIHEYVLELLATVGLRVDSPRARELLLKNGCRELSQKCVAVPAELVAWAIEAAPATIDIYDRLGTPAFTLGAGDVGTRFGVGVTNLYYQESAADDVVPFTLEHVQTAARLGQHLKGFDLVSTPGVVQAEGSSLADLQVSLAMVANTTKPLVLLVSEEKLFSPVLEMLESLLGDLHSRPALLPYFNPITPLVLNSETAHNIALSVERGLPFIYNNYGMSGATAPITPASTLVVLLAELLGGLVYTQSLKEGAPVILGSLPAGFDMRTMMSLYTPHTMLLNLACAEMMEHYGIPHSGTSGSGSGWGADLLSAGALWLNHLTSCMGKVGLAPFVGGNFDSLAFSPAMLVLSDEIIRLSRQFAGGFALDDSTVALEDVAAIGPGGNFLMSEMTLELFRHMGYDSKVWPALTLEQWQSRKCPGAETMLHEYTLELIPRLEPPADHDALMAQGRAWIEGRFGSHG